VTGWWRDLSHDIVASTRSLAKDTRFTLAAVLALALAIGVNNSVFALINAALIRELPFEQPDRLVALGMSDGRALGPISYPDFADWRERTTSFAALAARANSVMVISEPTRLPERFRGAYVSAEGFGLLGVAPAVGRDFRPEDDRPGAPGVVILSDGVWERRYGRDPDVIGQTVRVTEVPSTIIGVMPRGFGFPFNAELWQPLSLASFVAKPQRDVPTLFVFGRLRDGVDVQQARSELQTVAQALVNERPEPPSPTLRADIRTMREDYRVRSPLLGVFMGAVALVLVVACANLANLLLARSVARSRELALRASLGASRWRLVRYLLVECGVIALAAAVIGTVLGAYGSRVIAVAFDPLEPGAPPGSTRPFWLDLSMDATMFAFVAFVSLLAAVACGLLPALHILRIDPNDVLKEGARSTGTRRTRRWASAVIVAEITVTVVLLSATGLLWRSFLERYQEDPIIDPSPLVAMRLGLPAVKYPGEARTRFYAQLDERLQALSSIESASMANAAPFESGAVREINGRRVWMTQAGDRYFETVGLRVVRGRPLTREDALSGRQGTVVDKRFAELFFPNDDPLGQQIQLASPSSATATPATPAPSPLLTIVGIAPTIPSFAPPEAIRPVLYVPLGAVPLQGAATILVRARDASGAAQALREQVKALDPNLALYAIEPVEEILARGRFPVRMISTWFSVIAAIAIVLVAVGLYSLTAHGVAERTREVGVRMALGANATQVVWLFVKRSLAQLTLGLGLGLTAAAATGRLLQAYLNQVTPRDPVSLTVVCGMLIAVAAVATILPARRAARLDPAVTLRAE
jgi:putative ABC transport system permease protein